MTNTALGLAKGCTHGPRFEAYDPYPEHQRVLQDLSIPIRADTLALEIAPERIE